MCLAIPGRIIAIVDDAGLPMGEIDFAGARNRACLSYTPEAEVGDYVLVHAGFALQTLNEDEARASLVELSRLSSLMAADAKPESGS